MGDDQLVISNGQAVTPETVANRSFTSAFRGYHPVEVRQFLKRISEELAAAADREAELRRALEQTPAPAPATPPELDEAAVTSMLGEHAAKLLGSARETAASIVDDARRQADAALRDADQRIARMRAEGEGLMARRVAEADAAATSIQAAARAEAEAEIEQAKQQGKEMVAEARAVRERMLADLSRRRRSAQVQIEQLRAVRERLTVAYDVVRRTVEEATAELDAAEPEARMAAEAVARRAGEPDAFPEVALPAPSVAAGARPAPSAPPAARRPEPARRSSAPATDGSAAHRALAGAPAAPDRPPLRPQTVAAASAGRTIPEPVLDPPAPPAPVVEPPAPEPVAEVPAADPAEVEVAGVGPADPPAPAPEPAAPAVADLPPLNLPPVVVPAASELATSEVPIVSADGPPSNVEALFARLRAGNPPGTLDEPAVAPDPPVSPAPPTKSAAVLDPVAGEHALEGRDDLLDNLESGLARALKRVLGDEQNEVLDGLRRRGATGAAILPGLDAQLAGYRDAAIPWLQQAARAGVGFASDPGVGTDRAAPDLEPQAEALARDLVEPLRERLSRTLAGAGDTGDPSAVAESLRATYRQWKVAQVEECARHHVMAAFSVGAFEATPAVATLQWLVDDDGHCPDCDDNALAGPTAKGEPFPTGQLHPPAHPGCRCLLVPITA